MFQSLSDHSKSYVITDKVHTLNVSSAAYKSCFHNSLGFDSAAYHSLKIHKGLPDYSPNSSSSTSNAASSSSSGGNISSMCSSPVYLARDVPYGDQPRHCMDIYIPAEAALKGQAADAAAAGASEVEALPQTAAAEAGVVNPSRSRLPDGSSRGAPVMVFCHGGEGTTWADWTSRI